MARLILVHGGMHGAWCWDMVLEPLRAAGHEVSAVDLPGRGADAELVASVTLQDWADAVSAVVDAGSTPVVLVGHSLGGLTTSLVAERRPDDIARVVYVAAAVPRNGEAALQILQQGAEDSLLFALNAMEFSADQSTVWFKATHVGPILYNTSSPADVAWATKQVVPDAVRPMVTPVALSAQRFGRVPKTYLATRQDRAVPIALQLSMAAAAGAEVIELDTDHSPFVSATKEFVRALDGAVRV